MDRDQALAIVHEHVAGKSLINHMLAVEAAMHAYARTRGRCRRMGHRRTVARLRLGNPPDARAASPGGRSAVRARGAPEHLVRCGSLHASTGVPRSTPMEKALYACDEITGLITAVALVRPSRSLHDLTARSVQEWGDLRFAAAMDRGQIERAAADLGVELWAHVDRVIGAMRTIAPQLGLDGAAGPT